MQPIFQPLHQFIVYITHPFYYRFTKLIQATSLPQAQTFADALVTDTAWHVAAVKLYDKNL